MGKSLMANSERAPIVRRVFQECATGRLCAPHLTPKSCCYRSFDLVRQERLKTRPWLRKSSRSIEQPRNGCDVLWRSPPN
jgi:hypothetical protein